MKTLRVFLFGCPRIYTNPDDSEVRLTRVVQTLFAYLLLQRKRTHSREVLAGLLWSDNKQERARACLNTALWRLRNALETHAGPEVPFLIVSQQGEVGFHASSNYWLDVEVFENLLDRLPTRSTQPLEEAQILNAEQAVELYRGELMEGYYEDWVLRERERLRNRYLSGLAFLMSAYHLKGNLEASLACGQKILQQEPLREEIHRAMMRLYFQAGQRGMAIQQYEICCAALKAELEITPMPETEMLFQRIVHHAGNGPIPTASSLSDLSLIEPYSPTFQNQISEPIFTITQAIASGESSLSPEMVEPLYQALEQLDQAQQLSDAAMEQFRQVVQILLNIVQQKK